MEIYLMNFVLLFTFLWYHISAESQFSIIISQYRKQSNRMLNGKCCGAPSSSSSMLDCNSALACPLRFRICLEYANSYVSSKDPKPYNGPCAHGSTETDFWGTSHMRFTKKYGYTYTFDIKHAWPGEIQIIIEVYDASNRINYKNNIIDRFVYRNIIKSTKSKDEWYEFTKPNGASIYTLSFKLKCTTDYYGPNCDKYCRNKATNYICDSNGNMICNRGLMGSNCNTTICKAGCHPVHGYCDKPGECKCTPGWNGTYCDQCLKFPGCKHGSCIDSPWTCFCEKNWAGPFCDKNLNYCADKRPCKNGGICENSPTGSRPYNCICPTGFKGQDCEIDPCKPNPCKKGACFKTKNSFYCQCFNGWTGRYCEKDISVCENNSCKNGGKCVEDVYGKWRCDCPPGFRGSECHIADPCENSQCKHATDCQVRSTLTGEYSCHCHQGWTGQFCDENIDDCKNNPCENGGTCQDLTNGYNCKCAPGYKGKNCEINVVCGSNNPCKNGGVCQETMNGFICKCKKGFLGKYCEIYKTGCSPNPCRNGAYCYSMESNDYFCECHSNFWGKRCEYRRPYCGQESCDTINDACRLPMENVRSISMTTSKRGNSINMNSLQNVTSICGKYGTCISEMNGESFRCQCQPGFIGDRCENNIDNCLNEPCRNNGVCIDDVNDFHCLCEAGFSGKRCEQEIDMCINNPCLNGGQCRPILASLSNPSPDFECECNGGWGGRLCHQSINTVCDDKPCLHGGQCVPNTNSMSGFQCSCPHGWTGIVCQVQRHSERACRQQPNGELCKNGGVCINVGEKKTDFVCNCKAGFEGQFCETNINECHPNPCFNGGNCTDLINAYKCTCPRGFFGTNCQTNRDECATNPCSYGSVCVDRIDGYECRCPVGRTGKNCNEIINFSEEPRPPSCVYENRIFDSGETWIYNCKKCKCDTGKIQCKDIPCGVWTCLKAQGPNDPFSCKSFETCYAFDFDPLRCFVPPCVQKAVCIRKNEQIPQPHKTWPPNTNSYCRPNGPEKNNYCAKLQLTFNLKNIPIGVTVDDICDLLKDLKTIKNHRNSIDGQSLQLSCDIDPRKLSVINVALYSSSTTFVFLESIQSKRPFVHFLSDRLADDISETARVNHTPLSGLIDIKVETKLTNDGKNKSSNIEKMLIIPLVIIFIFVIIMVIVHHYCKLKENRNKLSQTTAPSKYNNSQTNFNNKKYSTITSPPPIGSGLSGGHSLYPPPPTRPPVTNDNLWNQQHKSYR